MIKHIILTLILIVFISCKKEEGCTNPQATNYNQNAEEDDGSCIVENTGGSTGSTIHSQLVGSWYYYSNSNCGNPQFYNQNDTALIFTTSSDLMNQYGGQLSANTYTISNDTIFFGVNPVYGENPLILSFSGDTLIFKTPHSFLCTPPNKVTMKFLPL